jgi:hypothetical protein
MPHEYYAALSPWLLGGNEVVGFEGGVDFGAIEADDDVAGDVDNRDAALLALIDSFFAGGWIGFDVAIGVFNTELVEVLFGGVAKGTPRCAVDGNL